MLYMAYCEDGHEISPSLYSPTLNAIDPYCKLCGKPTVVQCPGCDTPFKNPFSNDRVSNRSTSSIGRSLRRPMYCGACGKPLPWTAAGLTALEEAIDLADLEAIEREKLMKAAPDLFRDSPRTELAAYQTKRVLSDLHGDARSAIVAILVQYTVKAAMKIIS